MPNLPISGYTVATVAHTDDKLLGLNVHDTTMASTGTDYAYPFSVIFGSLTGDITYTGFAGTIAVGAITLAKMANFAASSLMGNPTGSSAAPSAITLGTNLSFTGSVLNAASGGAGNPGGSANQIQWNNGGTAFGGFTMSGDATLVPSTGVITIGAGAVTLAKQANLAASSLMGNPTGSPAAPSAITLGSGLSFSGTTITATGGGGGAETSETANFNAAAGTNYVLSGGSAIAATLPTAVGIAGQQIGIRCAASYTNLCTIGTTSSQTIGPGAATTRIIYAGESVTLRSDGANWVRTAGVLIPCHAKMVLAASTVSIPSATQTQVLLDTTLEDTTGMMASPSGHTITIIRPGIYNVVGTGTWALPGTGQAYEFYTVVLKNVSTQVTYYMTSIYNQSGTIKQGITIAGSVVFSAGDALIVSVFQLAGTPSSLNLIGTSGDGLFSSLEVTELPTW